MLVCSMFLAGEISKETINEMVSTLKTEFGDVVLIPEIKEIFGTDVYFSIEELDSNVKGMFTRFVNSVGAVFQRKTVINTVSVRATNGRGDAACGTVMIRR